MVDKQDKSERKWVYNNDGESYDVSLLPEQGQQAIGLLVELDKDRREINKQSAILGAAAQHLDSLIKSVLTKDALMEKEN
tara:strand:+ start:402 stop:641 length:240 start_codon:yes stop_codon:yes gene_type:complete